MSTRGSSASHAVYGLEAPLAVSAAAAAAPGGEGGAENGEAEGGIVGKEECPGEQHHQARGHEAGAREEALSGAGQRHQECEAAQGASGAGVAVADCQPWSRKWTRFTGVMQVRLRRWYFVCFSCSALGLERGADLVGA